MYNNGVWQNPGANTYYGYGTPRPQAKNTQPLTPDQIAKLRQNGNGFDLKVTQEDLWRAACTHKEKDGRSTLVTEPDGTMRCTICGARFHMCDATKEEVQKATDLLIDMLQTSKTVYLDAPDSLVSNFYQMLALLAKFPDLWERAMQNFAQYDNTGATVNPMGPGYSAFNALNNLMTNPYNGYGYGYQQPYMAPMPGQGQYQQPYAAPQQAVQYPQYGYGYQPQGYQPQYDPNANPMAYGAPTAVAPQPGVIPNASAPAPAAAPAQAEVQQQQTFSV
jgi:hypothetical protein